MTQNKLATITPGPWEVDIVQIGKEFLKGRLQEAVVANGEVIAICGENTANARLIVNALAILEALEAMVEGFYDPVPANKFAPGTEIWISEVLDPASALIAKVRGDE